MSLDSLEKINRRKRRVAQIKKRDNLRANDPEVIARRLRHDRATRQKFRNALNKAQKGMKAPIKHQSFLHKIKNKALNIKSKIYERAARKV